MEDARDLVPGVDYPRTFQEVDEWFRGDAACREYIRRLRWPGGFICPHCGWTGEPWVTSRGLLHCRGCQGQTSLTTAAGQKQEACSSTGSLTRPSPSDRPRTTLSSLTLSLATRPPNWSEADTLYREYPRRDGTESPGTARVVLGVKYPQGKGSRVVRETREQAPWPVTSLRDRRRTVRGVWISSSAGASGQGKLTAVQNPSDWFSIGS